MDGFALMAIQKTKVLSNGISGNYWKITELHIFRLVNTIHYSITLFHNSLATLPLPLSKQYKFLLTDEELDGDLIEIGYLKIKEKAQTLVDTDIYGQPIDPPIPFDPDIAGGDDV